MADRRPEALARDIAVVARRAQDETAFLRSELAGMRLEFRQLARSRVALPAAFAAAAVLGAFAALRRVRKRPRRTR